MTDRSTVKPDSVTSGNKYCDGNDIDDEFSRLRVEFSRLSNKDNSPDDWLSGEFKHFLVDSVYL